jgi:outer membrane protein assembly factor BamB
VQALNPQDGSELWRVNYGEGYSVVPRPVYAHGMVYVTSGYGSAVAHAIKPGGNGDVTATHVVWKLTKRVPLNPSVVVAGDEFYMLADNGILTCADAKTGAIHYEERLLGESSSSLLYADGRIYAIDEKGLSAVVKAGKTFELLAKNDLAERTLASMAVVDSDLLIRTEKALYRVSKTGKM